MLIPKSRIESLGIGPNENLFVLSDTDESALEICKSDPESDTPSESISSNATGDILIEHEMLEFVDLDWLAGYKIETKADKLRISEL